MRKSLLAKALQELRSCHTLTIELLAKLRGCLTGTQLLAILSLSKARQCLSALHALTKQRLTKPSHLLRCTKLLLISLLAKTGLSLPACDALSIQSLPKARHLLSRTQLLAIEVLAKLGHCLRALQALSKQCLPQSSLLLGGTHLLAITLLADSKSLLRKLLLRSAVSLFCCQIDALLLLERAQSLPIAALQQVRDGLLIGKVLLISEIRLSNTCAVATEGPGTDCFTGQSLTLLSVLLGLCCHRLLNDVRQEGRHILIDALLAKLFRRNRLRSCQGSLTGELLEWCASPESGLCSPCRCAIIWRCCPCCGSKTLRRCLIVRSGCPHRSLSACCCSLIERAGRTASPTDICCGLA